MSKKLKKLDEKDLETPEKEVENIPTEQISIRFECLKFAQTVKKENIENLWATRKQVPEEVSVDEIINDAEKIWEYLISN